MKLQDILLCSRYIDDDQMIDVVHKMFVKYMCCVFFQYFPPSCIPNNIQKLSHWAVKVSGSVHFVW